MKKAWYIIIFDLCSAIKYLYDNFGVSISNIEPMEKTIFYFFQLTGGN